MPGESQLNVYILGSDLSPRQRERLQAQVQAGLRSLPPWTLGLVSRRIEELGVRNLPLIVEPAEAGEGSWQALGLGELDGRPAVRLRPRLRGSEVDWGQDRPRLIAKAVAYLAAPDATDRGFWSRWEEAVEQDHLREATRRAGEQWADSTTLDLFLEMFAAYALSPQHARWRDLASVKAFFAGVEGSGGARRLKP